MSRHIYLKEVKIGFEVLKFNCYFQSLISIETKHRGLIMVGGLQQGTDIKNN